MQKTTLVQVSLSERLSVPHSYRCLCLGGCLFLTYAGVCACTSEEQIISQA